MSPAKDISSNKHCQPLLLPSTKLLYCYPFNLFHRKQTAGQAVQVQLLHCQVLKHLLQNRLVSCHQRCAHCTAQRTEKPPDCPSCPCAVSLAAVQAQINVLKHFQSADNRRTDVFSRHRSTSPTRMGQLLCCARGGGGCSPLERRMVAIQRAVLYALPVPQRHAILLPDQHRPLLDQHTACIRGRCAAQEADRQVAHQLEYAVRPQGSTVPDPKEAVQVFRDPFHPLCGLKRQLRRPAVCRLLP